MKLIYDEPLSSFTFNFNLRRKTADGRRGDDVYARGDGIHLAASAGMERPSVPELIGGGSLVDTDKPGADPHSARASQVLLFYRLFGVKRHAGVLRGY